VIDLQMARPVPGIKIQAYTDLEKTSELVTDATGQFRFSSIWREPRLECLAVRARRENSLALVRVPLSRQKC